MSKLSDILSMIRAIIDLIGQGLALPLAITAPYVDILDRDVLWQFFGAFPPYAAGPVQSR